MGVLQKIFAPNNKKFYLLFEDAIVNLIEISTIFSKVTQEENKEKLKEYIDALVKLELENEKLTHKVLLEMAGNLVSPFDREDIHALASSLDNIADYILTTTKLLDKYDVTDTQGASHHVASEVVKFIMLLEKAMQGLSDKSSLNQLTHICVDMRDIADSCDELIEDKIAELFNSKQDINVIIRYKDHYDLLQDLLEQCFNTVNVIESIIIKYG